MIKLNEQLFSDLMKLNIQMFAEDTILENKKSTGGSPYAYYTVKVTPGTRTVNTISMRVSITGKLASSSSWLGTGSTMGLNAYIKLNGKEYGPIRLKETTTSWTGTTKHTASETFTVTDLSVTQTSITNVKVRVSRTGSATGDYDYGAALKSTSCSNITIEQGPIPTMRIDSIVVSNNSAIINYSCVNSINISKVQVVYNETIVEFTNSTPSTSGSFTLTELSGNTYYDLNLYGYSTSGVWSPVVISSFETYSNPININSLTATDIQPFSIDIQVVPSTATNLSYYTYEILYNSVVIQQGTSSNNIYSFTNLNPSTSYIISVTAHPNNQGDISPQAKTLNVTTLADQASVYIKNNSAWIKGKIYIKTQNGWIEGKRVYIKTQNGWVENTNN